MKEFLGTYYIIFVVISVILIFAFIGYFIDKKYPDEVKVKKEKEFTDSELLKQQVVESGASTLQESINHNATTPQVQTQPEGSLTISDDTEVDSL